MVDLADSASKDKLDELYDNCRRGLSVETFLDEYGNIFQFVHSSGLTPDLRTAKGRLKKLRDEVAPVARFVRAYATKGDQVQFPLDDGPIDCNLWPVDSGPRKIQITVAQGLERFHVMSELNASGIGRGYLGVTDDQSADEAQRRISKDREAYSTVEAQQTITHALTLSISKKFDTRGADTLLIDVPLHILPDRCWHEIMPTLRSTTRGTKFSEVYVVDCGCSSDLCLRLK